MPQIHYTYTNIAPGVLPTLRTPLISPSASSFNTTLPPRYPVVALGGTFDHLHAGHKVLLSMAVYVANRKIICGLAGEFLHISLHIPLLSPEFSRDSNLPFFHYISLHR